MPSTRIRCHVLEVDRDDDWSPRRSNPRDLLPWADPYIASLIHRLEQRYDTNFDDVDPCDPFAADDAPFASAGGGDSWDKDAFLPRLLEAKSQRWLPPVVGGFPLLDDCDPTDVADAL